MSGEAFDIYAQTVPQPLDKKIETAEFWRKSEPTFEPGTRQIAQGGMFPHQQAWWKLPNFIKVLVGGYGSGKTMSICKRMISLGLQNAPCPVALVSPTFPLARQTTYVTLVALLEGKRSIYGNRFHWTYNNTTHAFTIKFKGRTATIILYSGERPLGLRGPNLAAAGIDEPFIQDKEVFDQMIARVRHPAATHKEICITGTPEQLNWGYDLCEGELNEQHDVGVITASTRMNLALDDGYVGRLEGSFDGKAAEAYIEGAFVSLAEGAVYYAFEPSENVIALDRPADATLGVGMDFNVNPMAAAVFWRLGNHIHFFDEIELPNADTEYMCSELRDRYWDDGLREVFPDASGANRATNAPGGKSDFHYIREAGFHIRAKSKNPLRKDRYNSVNGKLRPKAGRLTLTICPTLKRLKKYLSVYSHEMMTQQDFMSHLLDAFSYPISFLFPVNAEVVRAMRMQGA